MNLFTIIVLLVLLFFILNGYRRGFIKTFVSMVSIVVAIVLVSIATPYVTQFLKTQTPLYNIIVTKCEETFGMDAILESISDKDNSKSSNDKSSDSKNGDNKSNDSNSNDNNNDNKDQGISEESLKDITDSISGLSDGAMSMLDQAQIIENLKLPKALQEMLEKNNNKNGYEKLEIKSFEQFIPNYMATLILNMISFIVTLLLVISFLWITIMTLDIITRLPVLHGINRILGLGLGLAQGLIVVWFAFLIITVFSNADIGKQLMLSIHDSKILSFLYDQNIFLKLLSDAMTFIF